MIIESQDFGNYTESEPETDEFVIRNRSNL